MLAAVEDVDVVLAVHANGGNLPIAPAIGQLAPVFSDLVAVVAFANGDCHGRFLPAVPDRLREHPPIRQASRQSPDAWAEHRRPNPLRHAARTHCGALTNPPGFPAGLTLLENRAGVGGMSLNGTVQCR